jgi:hypothetical protein
MIYDVGTSGTRKKEEEKNNTTPKDGTAMLLFRMP